MTDAIRPKILIVDDDPTTREILLSQLKDSQAEVLQAKDGYEALALLRRELCCLVLLDINMPGMSGYQVASALRADPKTAAVPVVFNSAALIADEPLDLQQQLADGDLFLAKPVDPDLLRQIARLFVRLHDRKPVMAPDHGRELERLRQEVERLQKENRELRIMTAGLALRRG